MFYQVLSSLRYNGEHYAQGDMVELPVKQAAVLIADGIVEKSDAKTFKVWQALKAADGDKIESDDADESAADEDKTASDGADNPVSADQAAKAEG